jgi:hypothetical protein
VAEASAPSLIKLTSLACKGSANSEDLWEDWRLSAAKFVAQPCTKGAPGCCIIATAVVDYPRTRYLVSIRRVRR